MKRQRTVLTNTTIAFAPSLVFLWLFLVISVAQGAMPVFSVVLVKRPLSLPPMPAQQAQATAPVALNLAPLVGDLRPEVDYQVTNNASRTLTSLGLIELPPGLIRVYEGAGVCPEAFTLEAHHSCVLRFIVDKTRYTHSLRGGPIVCYRPPGGYCSRPDQNNQIDDAVARVPNPSSLSVYPAAQDGLYYDPTRQAILGTPTRRGSYHFSITATNGVETSTLQPLNIEVDINPQDTPVFKSIHSFFSATVGHEYHLNLLDLIEEKQSILMQDQVRFHIDLEKPHPDWLSLDAASQTLLEGHVPVFDGGETREVTLIATSTTGGDSLPLTIKIPVIYDPTKKPVISSGIKLTGRAGAAVYHDFYKDIAEPSADNTLKVLIDNIEPAAPWIAISKANPTELDGIVPPDAVGQLYQLTLHANTAIGGHSEPVIIPLQIDIDPSKTPSFNAAHPHVPMLYAGEPYSYDFVENEDVRPTYKEAPYIVELAKGYSNPSWLRIEDNKLMTEKVPMHLASKQKIFITIKNTPGGQSAVLSLSLVIM